MEHALIYAFISFLFYAIVDWLSYKKCGMHLQQLHKIVFR